ncbi:hypothetical protein Tco_0951921 [Tanacetum coccineum]|uniref:Uncharacterized protein n=1 Tax=Tanacetum coccineum TaxID=301880 RepID=A0ABQ5DVI8_9ASTR
MLPLELLWRRGDEVGEGDVEWRDEVGLGGAWRWGGCWRLWWFRLAAAGSGGDEMGDEGKMVGRGCGGSGDGDDGGGRWCPLWWF